MESKKDEAQVEVSKNNAQDEGEEVEMTYEEFLIYSARSGDIEDIKECITEKVALDSKDPKGNTALRKTSPKSHLTYSC